MPINPYQKPLMTPTNQTPQGLPLEWTQMPGQEQEQQQMDQGIAGLGSLLKRFQKPPAGFGGGTPGGTDIGRSVKLPGFSGLGV